jgi:hypothetical protein
VTAGDLHALSAGIRQLFADGTLDAEWSELVDFREVTRTDMIPTAAVRELARNSPWPKSSRRVIVAPVTVVYGVSRMYQLLGASDEALAVVKTEAEALEFLTADRRSEGRPS